MRGGWLQRDVLVLALWGQVLDRDNCIGMSQQCGAVISDMIGCIATKCLVELEDQYIVPSGYKNKRQKKMGNELCHVA